MKRTMVFLLAAMKNSLNPDGGFLAGPTTGPRGHTMRLTSTFLLVALFAFAGAWKAAAGAASDGDGTMTVSPTSVTAGSTGNSFTFSFRDTNDWTGIPSPQATLTIPAGWTAPQSTTSGNPGYVTVTRVGGAANSASLTSISGSGPWTVTVTFNVAGPIPKGFDISYAGVTAPTTADVNTFTTQTKTSGGTLTTIKSGSSTVTVNGGTETKLAYTTVPSTGTAGTAFSVTVQSQDANGNPTNLSSATTITLSKATGAGTLSGTLTGTILTSGNSVTIATPVYSKSDTMTLTATASGGVTLTAVTSGNIVFSAGALDHFAISAISSPQTAGTAFAITTITAQDANNNTVTNFGGTVTFGGTAGVTGTSAAFISGVLSGASVTPTVAGSNLTVTVTDGSSHTGSATITTINKASTSVSVSSSENPAGFKDSVIFTASLPSDATGSVIFKTNSVLFDTETLSGGSTTTTNSTLPRGTQTITAEYAGDGNYTGSTNDLAGGQGVTNHPPVANAATYNRAKGTSIKINVTNLLAQFTSDADGDAVRLASFGSSTNGSTLTLTTNGTTSVVYIVLTPANNLPESFNYTVSDGNGGTNGALITVNVTNAVGQATGSISTTGGGAVTTTWAGIPGSSYVVQRSPDLSTWTDLWTTNAPTAGVFIFTDPAPPQPTAYYRLRQN